MSAASDALVCAGERGSLRSSPNHAVIATASSGSLVSLSPTELSSAGDPASVVAVGGPTVSVAMSQNHALWCTRPPDTATSVRACPSVRSMTASPG
jgi:hypothetical protein